MTSVFYVEIFAWIAKNKFNKNMHFMQNKNVYERYCFKRKKSLSKKVEI